MKRALLAVLAFTAAQLLSVATAPLALAQFDSNPIVRNAAQVFLIEETPSNVLGTRFDGTISWRLQQEVPEPGSETRVHVKVDIHIPARGLSVSLIIRPNPDPTVAASHFLETTFVPTYFQHPGISSIRGILMKSLEHLVGAPLQGYVAELPPNAFALALWPAHVLRNVQLLYGRPWLEIAIVYATGQRALLAFSKGAEGEEVLRQAFASWAQLDPQVAFAISRIDGQSQPTTPQASESEAGKLEGQTDLDLRHQGLDRRSGAEPQSVCLQE